MIILFWLVATGVWAAAAGRIAPGNSRALQLSPIAGAVVAVLLMLLVNALFPPGDSLRPVSTDGLDYCDTHLCR